MPSPPAVPPQATSRMRRRGRRFVAPVALMIGTTFAILLVVEGVIRLMGDIPPPVKRVDMEVGYRYARNHVVTMRDAESKREVELRFNDQGFRGPDWTEQAEHGTRRVAVLGDSFAIALSVPEEEGFVARLPHELGAVRPGTRWEALNFGVSSSSTGQQLALYRALVRRHDPDLVVVAFSTRNDLADNSRELTSAHRIYFELDDEGELVQLPLRAPTAGLTTWLNAHSRAYVWQKHVTASASETWHAGRDVRDGSGSTSGILRPSSGVPGS